MIENTYCSMTEDFTASTNEQGKNLHYFIFPSAFDSRFPMKIFESAYKMLIRSLFGRSICTPFSSFSAYRRNWSKVKSACSLVRASTSSAYFSLNKSRMSPCTFNAYRLNSFRKKLWNLNQTFWYLRFFSSKMSRSFSLAVMKASVNR